MKNALTVLAVCAAAVATASAQDRTGAQDEGSLKTAVNPSSMPDSLQYGYSQAVVFPASARMVYVAGQVGISETEENDFEAQVDRSFENVQAALDASGATVDDVVKITLLIVDHDQDKLAYLVEKRKAVFGNAPPASLLVPVPELYTEGVLFEVDAIAVTDGR